MSQLGTRTMLISAQAPDVTGAGAYTDFSDSVSTVTIDVDNSDPDFLSFAAARGAGYQQYTLKITAVQDTATGTLWRYAWANNGSKLNVKVNPYNSAAPAVGTPWFSGTVTISLPSGTVLGGDSDRSTTARHTVDLEWLFDAKPTELTS